MLQKITNNDLNKQNQCLSPYPSPVSSKSPTNTEYHNENQDEKGIMENHQKEHITSDLPRHSEEEFNTHNFLPVITQVTPVQYLNQRQSYQSDSVITKAKTSDEEDKVENFFRKGIESPSATDEEDEDDDEDIRELEGRTVTSKGQMVNSDHHYIVSLVAFSIFIIFYLS